MPGRRPDSADADGSVKGRLPTLLVSVLAAAGAAAAPASAEESDSAALLADMCASCHGPDGRSPGSIPALAPLNEEAMRAFLLAYRAGDIEATVMNRIARALTDAEIEALARRFGNLAGP